MNIFQKVQVCIVFAASLLMSSPYESAQAASLIGQTIFAESYGTLFGKNTPLFSFSGSPKPISSNTFRTPVATLDGEYSIGIQDFSTDSRIIIDLVQFRANGNDSFLRLSNFEFNDGLVISGVSIVNQMTLSNGFKLLDSSEISFNDNSVIFDFSELTSTSLRPLLGFPFSFNISILTGLPVPVVSPETPVPAPTPETVRPVPVPGAVFGMVLAGGALVARQRKNVKAKQTLVSVRSPIS